MMRDMRKREEIYRVPSGSASFQRDNYDDNDDDEEEDEEEEKEERGTFSGSLPLPVFNMITMP